jgi:hypothetical protein
VEPYSSQAEDGRAELAAKKFAKHFGTCRFDMWGFQEESTKEEVDP